MRSDANSVTHALPVQEIDADTITRLVARGRRERSLAIRAFFSGLFASRGERAHAGIAPRPASC